jgi:hypothetical protein
MSSNRVLNEMQHSSAMEAEIKGRPTKMGLSWETLNLACNETKLALLLQASWQ